MPLLVPAIVLITGALIAYTIGVWAERRAGVLRPWHAAMFALGLTFDASGTFLMGRIAASGATLATTGAASVLTQLMQVTGAAALVLMAIHLLWAVVVLIRRDHKAQVTFHRFSVGVWALWLVPYFTGMAAAMMKN
ncbi:HsmA family protein [Dermatophilus congolensis]|uniref:TIGR03987 family protein n=1 Tax=Dermatophilus congolensis TaxID=1863 RepID=A0AA46BLS7_9MICO|nr:HsmA family protein [Dermatophilus congolensis]MBO3142221.1 TIGR03987 family protein [Dermatophilus congolensis]MBO3151213.1 TIGR03987 family protein [Dermatophilus congolensis]MBO3161786.1 TIGR03987 family protein [Dermatophilus congolensis]MBO3162496.1 TIGR03987 family protein [Dermatophilus congolensis]MBO3176052.1 TIGR03987 family protein [Dermatophilus congolensis]